MQLYSVKKNKDYQLIVEDVVFDPAFAILSFVDSKEEYVEFWYDISECGYRFDIPFEASSVKFGVKFTPSDIYVQVIVQPVEAAIKSFRPFVNKVSEVEFSAKLTKDEKRLLCMHISTQLIKCIAQNNQQNN